MRGIATAQLCALATLCISVLVQASRNTHSDARSDAAALHALRGLANAIRSQLDLQARVHSTLRSPLHQWCTELLPLLCACMAVLYNRL